MRSPYLASAGIIAGAGLLQVANALIAVLLPVQLSALGSSSTVVGLVATAYGSGFLLGCLRAPHLVRSVGHIRAFSVLAAITSTLTLVYLSSSTPLTWIALRFFSGFALAGMYSIVEGWLAAAAPTLARGRVLGAYLVATKLATVAGQVLVGLHPLEIAGLFVTASGIFSLALVPIALTRTSEPAAPRLVSLQLGPIWRVAPASLAGCLSAGMLNAPISSLVPVWADRLGVPVSLVVVLLSAMQIGSLVLQWPLGWLSDRIDRRLVILGCAGAVAILSIVIATASTGSAPVLVVLFGLWGAVSMSFYGICVAHASDHAQPDEMVRVSSGALFSWASGSTIGPLIAAPAIDLIGPDGLWIYATAVSAVLSLFVAWRMTRRAPVPLEGREAFINLPATSPRLAEIDPRSAGRNEAGA
jgi:MFS family permease